MSAPRLARRTFLQGIGFAGAAVRIGLPPLACMFNSSGTAYAAREGLAATTPETRFVLWFNGNGIPERYWIPRDEGNKYSLTPCLSPLARAARRRPDSLWPGQPQRANQRCGQRPSTHHERLDVRREIHRHRCWRTVDRSSRRKEDRRQLTLPFPPNRSLPGILRYEHAAEHELERQESRAATRGHPAETLR